MLRNTSLPKGKDRKKATAVAKYYGFERRSIFSTEGSFGWEAAFFLERFGRLLGALDMLLSKEILPGVFAL